MSVPASLVMTVRNEAASLPRFLAALDEQTVQPAEVVIVDGGSTDGTLEILREWAAAAPSRVVVEAPGANISQGRNIAVGRASNRLVAVTDAGTRADADWLEQLTKTAEASGADVVSGFYRPDGDTWFERVLASVITQPLEEVDPETFQPSSRSVLMTRDAWAAAGGYPEWLDYCEDLLLDMRIRALGLSFAFCPRAQVTWSARPSLAAFVKQYYRYARGDGKAGIKARTHAVRFAVYAGGVVLVAVATRWPAAYALLGAGVAIYLAQPVRRLARARLVRGTGLVAGVLSVPVVTVAGDLARMAGYPVGVVWRHRNRPPASTG